jgi:hypothetical protein
MVRPNLCRPVIDEFFAAHIGGSAFTARLGEVRRDEYFRYKLRIRKTEQNQKVISGRAQGRGRGGGGWLTRSLLSSSLYFSLITGKVTLESLLRNEQLRNPLTQNVSMVRNAAVASGPSGVLVRDSLGEPVGGTPPSWCKPRHATRAVRSA